MKRSIILLLVPMLIIALLAGCGSGGSDPAPTPATDTGTADPPTVEGGPIDDGATEIYVGIDDARMILQTWINSHPFQMGSVIASDGYLVSGETQGEDYSFEGAGYYRFYLDIIRLGLAEILVHKETGWLFHLESPYSSSGFEPIDDWYYRDHAEFASPLSADDARAVYNLWLGNHADMSSYALEAYSHEIYEIDAEYYYFFHADEMSMYWYNVLVNMETGELLFMMAPDGEDSTVEIEPLDDWYDSNFAVG